MANRILAKIRKRTLPEQIVEQIVALVAKGKLRQGDRLPPERELMKQFGVGRSSIREAIHALSMMELVVVRVGSGTYIRGSPGYFSSLPVGQDASIKLDEVGEAMEARIVLEQALCGMAALRATEEDLGNIERRYEEFKAIKRGKHAMVLADVAFHDSIAAASHNVVLSRLLSQLNRVLQSWREKKTKLVNSHDSTVEQHEEIIKAIRARDFNEAQSALRMHLFKSHSDALTSTMFTDSKRRSKHEERSIA